jgi:hypothetical protein
VEGMNFLGQVMEIFECGPFLPFPWAEVSEGQVPQAHLPAGAPLIPQTGPSHFLLKEGRKGTS